MSNFELEDKLLILDIKTVSFLLSQENGVDILALYIFYYKTAKLQKTNQVWATRKFVLDALHWGPKRFLKAQAVLKKYNLVEVVKDSKPNGKWYIKINYIRSKEYQPIPLQSEAKEYPNELVRSDTTKCLNKIQSINAYTLTNVRDDVSPKRGSSCPLEKNQVWHERYPRGHAECVEYVNSFKFINKGKQFMFLHKMLRAGLDFPDIDKLIAKIEKKPYFKENGYDFATIASEADRSQNAYS